MFKVKVQTGFTVFGEKLEVFYKYTETFNKYSSLNPFYQIFDIKPHFKNKIFFSILSNL